MQVILYFPSYLWSWCRPTCYDQMTLSWLWLLTAKMEPPKCKTLMTPKKTLACVHLFSGLWFCISCRPNDPFLPKWAGCHRKSWLDRLGQDTFSSLHSWMLTFKVSFTKSRAGHVLVSILFSPCLPYFSSPFGAIQADVRRSGFLCNSTPRFCCLCIHSVEMRLATAASRGGHVSFFVQQVVDWFGRIWLTCRVPTHYNCRMASI